MEEQGKKKTKTKLGESPVSIAMQTAQQMPAGTVFLQGQEEPDFLPPGIFSSCCLWAARPNQLAAISC